MDSADLSIPSESAPQESSDLLTQVQAAQALAKKNRKHGRAALDELFRSGALPDPALDGRYSGRMLLIQVAPVYTQLAGLVSSFWMPWKGKIFNASRSAGINLFSRDSYLPAHLIWPFYRYYLDDGPKTYPFRTYTGPGQKDPDVQVLKIDYNLKLNPSLNVRRLLDELVQLADGFYLGKAHLKLPWGTWQTVAYFTLSQP
jgi:hypothetical protein